MKICINYYGQPRNVSLTRNIYDHFIHDQHNEFYILYTTWTTENVNDFKKIFTSAHINQIDLPNITTYNDLITNYNLDNTNQHKSIEHYVKGLYIKKMSYHTIDNVEKKNNINFDFIISLRTDIYMADNRLSIFYDYINKNLNNNIFLAAGLKFDVYNEGAEADTICISNKQIMFKVLSQFDILPVCTLSNKNIFHPETSFKKCLSYYKFNVINLNFRAFPEPL